MLLLLFSSYYHGCWKLTAADGSTKIEFNIVNVDMEEFGDIFNVYDGKMIQTSQRDN